MLNAEQLKRLSIASMSPDRNARKQMLQELGNPSSDEIVTAALDGLADDDRNVRVSMLRVLSHESRARAAEGILMGLSDSRRRVREVAVKCCGNFFEHPKIIHRLKEMVEDENEKRRIRNTAFHYLAGYRAHERHMVNLPDAALKGLGTLAKLEKYRSKVLFQLLRLDLSDEVKALLQEFVKTGTREEAVAATRALCGYKVIALGEVDDEKERKRIARTCDLAAGRVFYWIKRSEASKPSKS